ncbi:MAG: hypothetical protein QJR12_16940 [Mycobacterium sp.]|uniref:hypothetical protein n=1 Tax=Mycobacterium sp. TaxID=1785 RepID=UPI002611BBE2|nr:hypothetical protein [Mycobacterium sp.]MDI3315894.1 hypothetical protein [Mycobacterium sp.]
MQVTFLGTTSGNTGCPTVYATDRGTYLVQGSIVTDREALAELGKHGNGIPSHETVVEIPKELVKFFPEPN